MIVPPAGAKTTCPGRILPGSLHLFTHPVQRITGPMHAHFTRRYKRPGPFGAALFLFDALAAALVLALVVILASFVLAPGTAAPVRLSVSASDTEARAAETVGFVVSYENRGKLPLENASLAISLPDGFRTTSLEADSAMNTVIEPLTAHGVIPLGTIGPGGNGTVRVAGYMLQPADAVSDLKLIATFTGVQKEGQTIQTVSEAVVRTSGSALQLRWAGVGEPSGGLVAGTDPIKTLVVENAGAATVDGLHLAVGDASDRSIKDHLFALGPHEIKVIGEYDPRTYGARLYVVRPAEWENVLLAGLDPQEQLGAADGPRVEILYAKVVGANMVDVLARITSTGPALDRGGLRVFPQPWSAVDLTEFAPDPTLEAYGLPAGEFSVASGTPTETRLFRFSLKPDADTSALTMRAVASACVVSTDQCAWSSSERVAVQPASPTLAAELRYYTEEGEQLGRGPLPPRVAEKTEYWVVVRAAPGDITRGVELRLDMGSNVTYADKFSASVSGVPQQVGNVLVWRPDIIANDGAFTFAAALAFRPTADQVDTEAVIVRSVRLLGKDADGAQTEVSTGYLATDVPADTRAAEKGTRVTEALE